MDFNKLLNDIGQWVMTGGVRIFLVLLVLLVLYKIARLFLDHAIARLEKCENGKIKLNPDKIKPLLYTLMRVALVIAALILVLPSLGVDLMALLQTPVGIWLITSGLKIFLVIAGCYSSYFYCDADCDCHYYDFGQSGRGHRSDSGDRRCTRYCRRFWRSAVGARRH